MLIFPFLFQCNFYSHLSSRGTVYTVPRTGYFHPHRLSVIVPFFCISNGVLYFFLYYDLYFYFVCAKSKDGSSLRSYFPQRFRLYSNFRLDSLITRLSMCYLCKIFNRLRRGHFINMSTICRCLNSNPYIVKWHGNYLYNTVNMHEMHVL